MIHRCLGDWPNAKIVCVPGVMLRICLGKDSNGDECRLNYIFKCDEMIPHNHSQPFTTTCLSGEYIEVSWTIDPHSSDTLMISRRSLGGDIAATQKVHGRLRECQVRRHYAGNTMYVENDRFHSIVAQPECGDVLTFVVRHQSPHCPTFMLHSESQVDICGRVRDATQLERAAFFKKLVSAVIYSQI